MHLNLPTIVGSLTNNSRKLSRKMNEKEIYLILIIAFLMILDLVLMINWMINDVFCNIYGVMNVIVYAGFTSIKLYKAVPRLVFVIHVIFTKESLQDLNNKLRSLLVINCTGHSFERKSKIENNFVGKRDSKIRYFRAAYKKIIKNHGIFSDNISLPLALSDLLLVFLFIINTVYSMEININDSYLTYVSVIVGAAVWVNQAHVMDSLQDQVTKDVRFSNNKFI